MLENQRRSQRKKEQDEFAMIVEKNKNSNVTSSACGGLQEYFTIKEQEK